jgi:hypothetical protein
MRGERTNMLSWIQKRDNIHRQDCNTPIQKKKKNSNKSANPIHQKKKNNANEPPRVDTDGNNSIWPPVQAKPVQLTDHCHCHKSKTNTIHVAGP